MRRGRVFILLAFILILGTVALFLLNGILNPGPEPPPEGGTPEGIPRDAFVVFAVQRISRGSKIPPDAVKALAYPSEYIVEGFFTSVDQVVDHRARQDIPRGVPITQTMITDQPGDVVGVGSDAAIAIPPGLTAISVPMTRLSGVAYALQDGDQVDVLITLLMLDLDPRFQTKLPNESAWLISPTGGVVTNFTCRLADIRPDGITCQIVEGKPPFIGVPVDSGGFPLWAVPQEDQRPRLVTQRLITNATVLHVGTFALPEEEEAPIGQPPSPEEDALNTQPPQGQETVAPAVKPPDIVTLIVKAQDALALNWAIKSGADLTLTLRSPNDPTIEEGTSSVTLRYMVDNYSISVPSAEAFGTLPRLDLPISPVLPNDEPQTEEVQ